jgi:hypothetical protein
VVVAEMEVWWQSVVAVRAVRGDDRGATTSLGNVLVQAVVVVAAAQSRLVSWFSRGNGEELHL